MLTGIDHLVIAVADPDAAADAMERELGLAFTGGGRHEHAGTFNRLAFLGDSYVELIGVFDRAVVLSNTAFAVGRASLAFLESGSEGLATWAVATNDIERDTARLRAGGSRIAPPVEGSRTRPDGEVVRWRTAFPPLGPGEPPFLIEHEMTGAEWGPEARAARGRFAHPVGGRLRMAGLELAVADPVAAAAKSEQWSGLGFGHDLVASMGAQTVGLRPSGGGRDALPTVSVAASDPATPALELVRFGVRWQRRSDSARAALRAR
jgi:hypothetical protein